MSLTRVVTTNSGSSFVYQDKSDLILKGICVDLWKQTAADLNLTYEMEIATNWEKMMTVFRKGKTDVIVERMDDITLRIGNITK